MHIREFIRLKGGNEYKEGRGAGRVRQKDIFSIRHGNYEEERGIGTGEVTGEGGNNNNQNNQDDQGNQSNQEEQEERNGHRGGYGEYISEDEWEEWL